MAEEKPKPAATPAAAAVEATPAAPKPTTLPHTANIAQLSVGELSSIISAEVARALAERLRPGQASGVHVNSGPPGFVNGGGHSNFDPPHANSGPPGFVNGGGHANFDPVLVARPGGGAAAGVHVNSGPPGFVNGGGHANFDPRVVARPGAGAAAGVHVNSGPPGFVNGGGHANFDPTLTTGSHVNSGPPGFVNGGGHANFDPQMVRPNVILTLPDGSKVQIPATGRLNFRVRGFHIQR